MFFSTQLSLLASSLLPFSSPLPLLFTALRGVLAVDMPGVIYFDNIVKGGMCGGDVCALSLLSGRKVLKKSIPPFASTTDAYTIFFDKFWLSHEYIFVVVGCLVS